MCITRTTKITAMDASALFSLDLGPTCTSNHVKPQDLPQIAHLDHDNASWRGVYN